MSYPAINIQPLNCTYLHFTGIYSGFNPNKLKSNVIEDSSITLFTAVLNALTNLTTLNDSHLTILPYVPILCELLQECDVVQIKVGILCSYYSG